MPISWWIAPIIYVGRGRTHPSCCIGASLQQFLYPIWRGVAKIKIPTVVNNSVLSSTTIKWFADCNKRYLLLQVAPTVNCFESFNRLKCMRAAKHGLYRRRIIIVKPLYKMSSLCMTRIGKLADLWLSVCWRPNAFGWSRCPKLNHVT